MHRQTAKLVPHAEHYKESADAATNTKEALLERTPAEERAQPLHPGTEQDSCVASSLSHTIDELKWNGTDDEVAKDLIN